MTLRKLSFGAREVGHFRTLCHHAQQFSSYLLHESSIKRSQQINKLKADIDSAINDELLENFNTEALATVINNGIRTSLLKSRISAKIGDEVGLSSVIQTHKEEVLQHAWNRRLQTMREMRCMFGQGSSIVQHLGELIAHTTLDLIRATDRNNTITQMKDGIAWGLIGNDDITSTLSKKIFLQSNEESKAIVIQQNRLDFSLSATSPNATEWVCLYATRFLMRAHSLSRAMSLELVQSAIRSAETARDSGDIHTSFLHVLARTLDLVHPGHHILADIISYPLYVNGLMRRKLISLGYGPGTFNEIDCELKSSVDPAPNLGTASTVVSILNTVAKNLHRKCRWYMEFTVSSCAAWRVGVEMFHPTNPRRYEGYPGMTDDSMGISFDGHVFVSGVATHYLSENLSGYIGNHQSEENDLRDHTVKPELSPTAFTVSNSNNVSEIDMHSYGMLVDMTQGTISLVVNNQVLTPPAFGPGARHYPLEKQNHQLHLIQTQMLVPMFALNRSQCKLDTIVEMRVNFGMHPFIHHPADVVSANDYLTNAYTRDDSMPSIHDKMYSFGSASAVSSAAVEEDERVEIALEVNQFSKQIFTEEDRSWSHFPPAVYKRSLAATKVQRAWRVYRARRWRKSIIRVQTIAAIRIQTMVRQKLARIRENKNSAARIIQRNWRLRLYIHKAILRIRYQRPIGELHQAAKTIQTKYTDYAHFQNSPFASRFRKKLEVLNGAATVIQNWWRPLCARIRETRTRNHEKRAATVIQRVWRGYTLRSMLRPDICVRLSNLGKSLNQHRQQLLEIRAAMRIQAFWRDKRLRWIRLHQLRTKNLAATRLQAVWKGYWVRSHMHLRFEYSESIFLNAVCKNLRTAHFIIRMYKTSGIVCPRRNR